MEFWFITGSQHLYGEETLKKVAAHSNEMVTELNKSELLPFPIICKNIVTTPDEITTMMREANHNHNCAGIITFMHTFSPSKMWIMGLSLLEKPYCHLHTQFNREIPWDEIDMDFMNLNQSAHGDREHGFIAARLRKPRKVIVGFWQDDDVKERLADFMRMAVGVAESKRLKVARFGDNMREVAVTEGDKVEAQLKLGWSVNYHPIGDLVKYIDGITDTETEELFQTIAKDYTVKTSDINAITYQLKIELGLKQFLEQGGFGAFTTNFEDLHGLSQLPGMACQRLMAKGYGFGGEGDWKTSALTRIMKVMGAGKQGGTSFMEDYTYHLEKGNELILGAHMLEVCPSIAKDRPAVEVHPLSIGGKVSPARLTFTGREGDAILVSLIDMGGRMRMIVQDVTAVTPPRTMPKLPVAVTMWKPHPNLKTAAEAWLLAGGAHHTVMSYQLTAQNMKDFAEYFDIEFIHINKKTDIAELKKELLWNDLAYKLK